MWVKSTQNTHNFSLFQPNTAHSVCVNGMTAFPHFTHTNNLHVGCAEGRIYYLQQSLSMRLQEHNHVR